jgi:hypothetical protein
VIRLGKDQDGQAHYHDIVVQSRPTATATSAASFSLSRAIDFFPARLPASSLAHSLSITLYILSPNPPARYHVGSLRILPPVGPPATSAWCRHRRF